MPSLQCAISIWTWIPMERTRLSRSGLEAVPAECVSHISVNTRYSGESMALPWNNKKATELLALLRGDPVPIEPRASVPDPQLQVRSRVSSDGRISRLFHLELRRLSPRYSSRDGLLPAIHHGAKTHLEHTHSEHDWAWVLHSFPAAKMRHLPARLLRSAPISPILFTTLSER